MILEYVLKYHLSDCVNIISQKDVCCYYSINIDFLKLFENYPDVGDKLLCSPIETLQLCNESVIKAQEIILTDNTYKIHLINIPTTSVKKNVKARFYGLPVCPELHRILFPKNIDLGCFLKVTGTVVRVTQSKMLEYRRKYICNKCKHETIVEGDYEHRYILKPPTKCTNNIDKCKYTQFTQVQLVSREHCRDYQEIKIQEQINKLNVGSIPSSLWVTLEDDLVDRCKPGDDVHICGTVRRRWRPLNSNKKCDVELVLESNHIEVCNNQKSQVASISADVRTYFDDYWIKYNSFPLIGRDNIITGICPQVYGLHIVKLALLLTIITGSNHESYRADSNDETSVHSNDQYTMNVRGQCHLLFVGDPGTGKSQLLRTGAELSPRSVLTSGTSSTRAGLTCSALRENGEWQLEAGALVLCDGGVCCIDEVGRLPQHERASVHEAMEQQTISVAKAGIVCKLNTRCSVIAACNPKGHYDVDQPLSVNVSLGTPLLSRFDLIFILLDRKNEEWDKLVSSYILFDNVDSKMINKTHWDVEKLQMYISLVGPFKVSMSKSANSVLQAYYMQQRQSTHRDQSRTTVRMLDSLVRLSQAHCKLMYRNTVLTMDAITAVSLVDLSMQDHAQREVANAMHSIAPTYPDFQYLIQAKQFLEQLNLINVWNEELIYYAKLLNTDHKTLEDQISKGNYNLFKNHVYNNDDNVPLSANIVSKYFRNPRYKRQDKENDVKNEIVFDLKLAETLNKITCSKSDMPPQAIKLKSRKKRKIVNLNCDGQIERLEKKSKVKTKTIKSSENEMSDEEFDNKDLLKNVPSVYDDIFGGLELNFKTDIVVEKPISKPLCEINSKENCEIVESKLHVETSLNNCKSVIGDLVIDNKTEGEKFMKRSKIFEKLKQFQCITTKDYSEDSITKSAINVDDDKKNFMPESIKEIPVGSQCSIFETDDYEFDI